MTNKKTWILLVTSAVSFTAISATLFMYNPEFLYESMTTPNPIIPGLKSMIESI